MDPVLSSTLLLTTLMGVGLVFFLRAASKDRTTTVEVNSSRPPLEVLEGLRRWLLERGWSVTDGDPERQVMRFEGSVAASTALTSGAMVSSQPMAVHCSAASSALAAEGCCSARAALTVPASAMRHLAAAAAEALAAGAAAW